MPDLLPEISQLHGSEAGVWSDDLLEYKRYQTDPLADEMVRTILEKGLQQELNEVFATLLQNDNFLPASFAHLPTPVSELLHVYFEESRQLPPWADQQKLSAGARVFSLYGPEIALLLNVKSLPMCYSCWRGAYLLHQTGRLSQQSGSLHPLARRLMETSQMVMHVLSPDSMLPGGKGIMSVQKVRLIHAAIRYYAKNRAAAAWDTAVYGEPINQEDMAGTLMSFSALVIRGLEQLNISLSAAEKEGFMHSWRVVGSLLGIHEELLPQTYEDGWQLGVTIVRRQAAPSAEGRELTRACIDFLKYVVPGNVFDDLPEYFIGYFMQDVGEASGKDLQAILGLQAPDSLKGRLLLKMARLLLGELDELDDHSALVSKISILFKRELLRGFLRYYNEGKETQFFIPPSLREDWKL